jgi:hypothetical protein
VPPLCRGDGKESTSEFSKTYQHSSEFSKNIPGPASVIYERKITTAPTISTINISIASTISVMNFSTARTTVSNKY